MMELLMVIALTGIITAAITTAFFQVFDMSRRTSNHMIAVTQVQQAGKLVSEDMLEAQEIDIDPSGPGEFLKLSWISQNTSTVHNITYTMEIGQLWRSESIDGGNATLIRVAEYINLYETSWNWSAGVLTFTVTATVGDESEQRTYQVRPRSELLPPFRIPAKDKAQIPVCKLDTIPDRRIKVTEQLSRQSTIIP